jgi:uncharacterized membrane protein
VFHNTRSHSDAEIELLGSLPEPKEGKMPISSGIEAILRWIHVLAGIIWLGHLYFFNFVNAPLSAKLDAATKKNVVPELMPRALFWFRWGAAWTWATGLLMLLLVYYMNGIATEGHSPTTGSYVMLGVTLLGALIYDLVFKSALGGKPKTGPAVAFFVLAIIVYLFSGYGDFNYRGVLIHTGALFGTIMAFNVWFRIWPSQQKIIRAVKEGAAPEPALVKLAAQRSRHNTYLSIPLLWAMIGQHTVYFAGGNFGLRAEWAWAGWLVIILLGWHIAFHLLKIAGRISGL